MLPPGHLAGGFLAAKIASIWLPQLNQPEYMVLSALFGNLPDLDFFAAFWKKRRFIADEKINHHEFITHTPILYVVIFLIWLTLFPNTWLVAATFILGTMSHFVLDTIASDGVRWFYPFSRRIFRTSKDPKLQLTEKSFLDFWIDFVKQYLKFTSAKLELGIVTIAILTLILIR